MKQNCWQVMQCGRGRDGDRSCLAATIDVSPRVNGSDSGGRVCWAVSGTLCGGVVQGTSALKLGNCVACRFFARVRTEEGADFCAGADVVLQLSGKRGLEESYGQLIAAQIELKRVTANLAEAAEKVNRASTERLQAMKLAAIGQLAAGVAHEINTPLQFVNDSVVFIRDTVQDLTVLVEKARAVLLDAGARPDGGRPAAGAEEPKDLQFLLEHLPKAAELSLEGVARITAIVRSMTEFAYPDQPAMSSVDLGRALLNTLTIARNEYRDVADVETELDSMPPVTCYAGEINQAFLNIIVNAGHAIDDAVKGTLQRGRITVRARHEGDTVLISIGDTGGGIPHAIQDRVYDPFFTTKEVGRGTGQGLAIARWVVVDKHGGQLWFESTPGEGTTFFVRLPVAGRTRGAA